jgi:hypothetical protein
MWHVLSRKTPVVLMPHGLVWYRRHDNQEISNYKANPEIALSYFLIAESHLTHTDCPMELSKNEIAVRMIRHKISRYLFYVIRNHGINEGIKILKLSKKSGIDLLKYFFNKGEQIHRETLGHVSSN